VARLTLGRGALVFAVRVAPRAVDGGMPTHRQWKVGMALVTALALLQGYDLGFVDSGVGMNKAAVAICALHSFFQMDRMIGRAISIAEGSRIGMARDTLCILDADEDPDGLWVIPAQVGDQLLGPANFFLNEPGDARLGVTVQASGAGGVLRGLPRPVVEIHLVARIAEPRLVVDSLKACASDDKEDEPGGEQEKEPPWAAWRRH
jgi:hypothetical protein